ncbi:MAG: family 20 glycosylhydrolase [Armatimonadota bacterium]
MRLWGPTRTISRGDLRVSFPQNSHGPVVEFRDCVVFRNAFFKVRSQDYKASYFNSDRRGASGTSTEVDESDIGGCPALSVRFETPQHGYVATYRLVLEDERTLRVEYQQTSETLEDAHLEFCPLIISPNPVMGRMLEAESDDGRTRLLLPLKPRPHDERFFDMPPARRITVYSRVARLQVATIGETPGLGLVDFRASQFAAAEALEAFLLYGRYRVPIGEQRLTLRVRFEEPEGGPEPTQQMLEQARMVPDPPPDENELSRLIVPHPQQVQWRTGELSLDGAEVRMPAGTSDELLRRMDRIPLAADVRLVRTQDLAGGLLAIGDRPPARTELPALPGDLPEWAEREAYSLAVTPGGATLRAGTERGLWNGWLTLVQLSERSQGSLACGSIADWPGLRLRGYHFNPRRIYPNEDLAGALIELLARLKYTHVTMQFKGDLELQSHPEGFDPERHWTQEQIGSLVEHARALGLEPVPEMKLIGHARWAHGGGTTGKPLEQLPHLQGLFDPSGTTFCPQSEEAAALARAIIDEVAALFGQPELFHISGDEAGGWASCERCQDEDAGRLLADWVTMLHDRLAGHGCRTMMWGDMLLEPEGYPDFTAAHAVRGTERAIRWLPRDIVIADWHYGGNEAFPTARYFQEQGFEVVGCPWQSRTGILNWGRQLAEQGALGIMGTSWHKLMSSLDTLAVVAEAAWNPLAAEEHVAAYDAASLVMDRLETLMAAGGERIGGARTIDLSAHANVSIRDERAGDGEGWLDFGPLRDLREFPVGKVSLLGVPFEVPRGEANGIMLHSPVPPCDRLPREVSGIEVGVTARRLHLLMGYGFDPMGRPPVATLRLRYDAGEAQEVQLQAGTGVRHWLVREMTRGIAEPPLTLRTAWRGRTLDGTPARVSLITVDCDAERTLQSIDLLATDAEAAVFVLAVTAEVAAP